MFKFNRVPNPDSKSKNGMADALLCMYKMQGACLGSAGSEKRSAAAHGQGSNVGWVEAVNVLLQADGIQDPLLVDVLRQGQLHKDAMHLIIRIVICHHLYQGQVQQ